MDLSADLEERVTAIETWTHELYLALHGRQHALSAFSSQPSDPGGARSAPSEAP